MIRQYCPDVVYRAKIQRLEPARIFDLIPITRATREQFPHGEILHPDGSHIHTLRLMHATRRLSFIQDGLDCSRNVFVRCGDDGSIISGEPGLPLLWIADVNRSSSHWCRPCIPKLDISSIGQPAHAPQEENGDWERVLA